MKKEMLAGCSVLLFTMPGFAGPYDAWSKYREITVNTTNANGGAAVAGTVANFPLLVRLASTSEATGANVLSDDATGASVRFSSADGETALAYEIESWSNAAAAIWVRVPGVTGNGNTVIRIHWGKTGEPSASDGAAVFDTASGYRAVWHLNETASPSVDATIFASPANWINGPVSTAGAIGNAVNFDNSSGATDLLGRYMAASYNVANNNFKVSSAGGATISAWINRNGTNSGNTANQAIAGRYRFSNGTSNDFSIPHRQAALMTNPGGYIKVLRSPTGSNTEAQLPTGNTGTVATAGQWFHVSASLMNGSQVLYVNGAQSASAAVADLPSLDSAWSDAAFVIAKLDSIGSFNHYFNGIVDEVRLSSTMRSADWVKLEYETQKPVVTAVTLGAVTGIHSGAARPSAASFSHVAQGRGILFRLPQGTEPSARAGLSILDMRGREVWSHAPVTAAGGALQIAWDGLSADGRETAAGMYLARMTLFDTDNRVVRILERKLPLAR